MNPSTSERSHFVLGYGVTGTAGDVSLTLSVVNEPKLCLVEWGANVVPEEIEQKIVDYANRFLRDYVAKHPQFGLHVIITSVVLDPIRKNDLERVTNLALRKGIISLSLPVVPLFEEN